MNPFKANVLFVEILFMSLRMFSKISLLYTICKTFMLHVAPNDLPSILLEALYM